MLADLVETLFTPATILWMIASASAGLILVGAMNRRRTGLTESLRKFVDKRPKHPPAPKPTDGAGSDADQAN